MAAPPGGKLRLSWPLAHHFLRQGGGERGQLHNQSRTERSFQRGLTTVAHRAGTSADRRGWAPCRRYFQLRNVSWMRDPVAPGQVVAVTALMMMAERPGQAIDL